MSGYYAILSPVLTIFMIIGAGFILRRTNVIDGSTDKTIFRIVTTLLYPCLIIDSMVGNPALHQASISLVAPVTSIVIIVIGVGIGWFFAPLAGLKTNVERRTFAASTGISNYAFFAVPVLLVLFDPNVVGVCFAYNMGSELSMWTLIVMIISGHKLGSGWRKLISGPFLAILISMVLNLFPVRDYTPAFLWTTISMFGKACIPFGLAIVGASFCDFIKKGSGPEGGSELFANKRVPLVALLVRSVILPLIIIGFAKFLPVPTMFKQLLVVQAAMPAATFPVAMSQYYGGHMPTAVRVTLTTTLAAFITTPLWIHFGLLWVF